MIGSIEKLLANVAAPIAALYAIGYLAQVVNIWVVARQNYNFRFITAWHVASLIDRTVVIGIGLKYLFFFWFIAVAIWFLAAKVKRKLSTPADSPAPSNWTLLIGGPTPGYISGQTPSISTKVKADGSRLWLGSLLLAVVLALGFLFTKGALFPTPVAKNAGDREVLTYLPYVNMTVAGNTEEAANNVDSDGQLFTGTAKPSENEGEGVYTVTGSIDPDGSNLQDGDSAKPEEVEGILLSHNPDYWYVFAEEGAEEGTTQRRILVIPAGEVSEICIVRANTPAQIKKTRQGRDCIY